MEEYKNQVPAWPRRGSQLEEALKNAGLDYGRVAELLFNFEHPAEAAMQDPEELARLLVVEPEKAMEIQDTLNRWGRDPYNFQAPGARISGR